MQNKDISYLLDKQIKTSLSTLTAAQKNVLHYVLKSFIYSSTPLDVFKPIPQAFFLSGLSKRYSQHLKELVQIGILEVLKNPTNGKEIYCFSKKSQPKQYRFNPSNLSGLKKIAWESEPMQKRSYMATAAEQKKQTQTALIRWTAKNLESLTIEAPDHQTEINKIVTNEFIDKKYSYNEIVEGNKDCFYYCIDGEKREKPITADAIAKIAKKQGKKAML